MTSLSDLFVSARSKYVAANPKSLEYFNSKSYLPGGNTRSVLHHSPFPLTFVSGASCKLKSVDGNQYIDFLGEFTAGLFGHNNQKIRDAINKALDNGISFGGANVYEGVLAERLCTRFGLDKVRFTNSGTEANMIALAAAKTLTGRSKILLFNGAYHGATLSFRPGSSDGSPLNIPHEFVLSPYNDMEALSSTLASLPNSSLAAIMIEPMQGVGGAIPASVEFLQALRSYATENQTVLIFDEVQTSRLGVKGLGQKLGIIPDVITAGKYLAGGMSFGMFGGLAGSMLGEGLMKLFEPGGVMHPGTFNNNVLSMAAGIAASDILTMERLEQLNELGDDLQKSIKSLLAAHSVNKMNIRGLGSVMVFWFVDDLARELWWFFCVERGVYFAPRGFVALSLEIRKEHTQKLLEVLKDFLTLHKQYLL